MKTVRRLLQTKGDTVWTTTPEMTASDAMRLMVDKDIGALVVRDGDHLVGIVTERDVARKLAVTGHVSECVQVREIMTDRVLYVQPEQTIEECMALMTDKHLRHLPVLDGNRLIGLISIRDVVADMIAEKSFMIEQLEHYIYEIPPYSRLGQTLT